ncbi:MAG: ABC transporter ATP-binding protein [Eubacterium sp.]|nr:ABC transporter ATP-binding protein [Eubacterium sp.]
MDTILKTRDLTKKFGNNLAVNQVSMNIQKGDIYGFIGKNGAGKTTFMRMILSLARPTEGEIELFSDRDLGKNLHRVGSLIEAPGLYNKATAQENLYRFAKLYGSDPGRIPEILDFVGLGNTQNKKAGAFSLGMRQRLGIAIAMLGDPEFMVLDEPVNGLDPAGMREVRNLILRLNQERGITVLISSHLLEELSKLVTRYGIINNGTLIEEITASELEEKSGKYIKISVDQGPRAAEILGTIVAPEKIQLQGNEIRVLSDFDKAGLMNQTLVKEGIMVDSLYAQTRGLEEYFMARIGG